MAGKIYVARASTFLTHDGNQVQVKAGVTRVREGHSLLKSRPDLFEEIRVHYDVEDARRAPQDEPVPAPEPKAEAPAPAPVKAAPAPRPQRGPRKSGA